MKRHHTAMMKLIAEHIGTPKTGVEVGVFRGATATAVHSVYPDCQLTLVDTWLEWPEDSQYRKRGSKRMGKLTQVDWDAIYLEAVAATGGGPHLILRMTSERAAEQVGDDSQDFVFIDADHSYCGVRSDIELWRPKTKTLMMGHDFNSRYDRKGIWGVKRAVEEAFGAENVLVCGGNVWGVVL